MKILLITNYFPPEIGAAANLYFILAKSFIKLGNDVTVLTGTPRYNVPESIRSYHCKIWCKEEMDGIGVYRVKLPLVPRDSFIKRGLERINLPRRFIKLCKHIDEAYDVSLIYSPPITLGSVGIYLKEKFGTRFVLNVQDLFPQNAIDLGLIKDPFSKFYFRKIEMRNYAQSDLITVHSPGNAKYISNFIGDKSKKIKVVPNCVDTELVKPGKKRNEFSSRLGIYNKFVVSFAGTLGISQDINIILNAAKILKNNKDILFLIVGDGPMKKESIRIKENLSLDNVLFHPTVPFREYPLVLNASDISLATLRPSVKTPVVPSKILSIMSSGIPALASMNKSGDAPKLIKESGAGFVVNAGDYKGLADKILYLYKNPSIRKVMGNNGRKFILENFSSDCISRLYINLFKKILN